MPTVHGQRRGKSERPSKSEAEASRSLLSVQYEGRPQSVRGDIETEGQRMSLATVANPALQPGNRPPQGPFRGPFVSIDNPLAKDSPERVEGLPERSARDPNTAVAQADLRKRRRAFCKTQLPPVGSSMPEHSATDALYPARPLGGKLRRPKTNSANERA